MSWIVTFRRLSPLKKLQNPQIDKQNPLLLLYSSSLFSTSSAASPPPIRVSLTESTGRGTFATRKIAAGDLIHTAKPLITHPSVSLLNQACYLCLKRLGKKGSDNLSSVLGNPSAYFCSEECGDNAKAFYEVERSGDWTVYDEHCKLQGLKYPFLVKRFACMVISGAASADSLDILQPTSLFPEMISKMEEEFKLLKNTFIKAGIDDRQMAFLTKEWYIGVLARIRINAFRIELVTRSYEDLFLSAAASVDANDAVGNAVYMLPSFYNHDCDPNVHIVWIENANARLKALRDIKEGEELCICYIDASMDRDARQTLLYQGFGFHCYCPRCRSGD